MHNLNFMEYNPWYLQSSTDCISHDGSQMSCEGFSQDMLLIRFLLGHLEIPCSVVQNNKTVQAVV